ncbi:MAG: DUF4924 family protein [Bacteroidota bacterium]|nr:DUF4924 family protein [Bacteroidota bacterium]
MLIAQAKKKENIAEYILYMWQVEDQIRAFGLDIDLIQAKIIDAYDQPDKVKADIRSWYESLIDMMKREGVAEKGHIQLNKNVIIDLTDLHNRLLASSKETFYQMTYYKVLPFIVELRAKASGAEVCEIETCLNLMYGLLMLHLQHKAISKGTQEAARHVSEFLGLLAVKFKQDRDEGLDLDN